MKHIYQYASFRKKLTLFIVLLLLSGCSALVIKNFNEIYGPSEPRERVVTSVEAGGVDYLTEVKPILDNRCVVCHGCYDAPCQLKLTSIEGLERGSHKTSVYNTSRLTPASPTRLYEDAHTIADWRKRNFFPVLNEHNQELEANKAAGVMYQLLLLKEQHPLPNKKTLGDDFSFGIKRKEFCPKPEEIETYKKKRPLWGMPYALPGLNNAEQSTLMSWLEQGAKYTRLPVLPEKIKSQIATWELFLNKDSLKEQLVSRYIYEHLFLGHLYFDGSRTSPKETLFFKLVRSRTPPGSDVDLITTRRPYDDPKVSRVYYRLVPVKETIVAKAHMPYALNEKRMQRWRQLFIDENYTVDTLPAYERLQAANPFKVFSQLPMKSRYKFMLDEAQFTIMNYIKGPVCRGSVALNVINDHFWVFFLDPDLAINDEIEQAAFTYREDLELPSAVGDSYIPLIPWKKYAKKERENRKRRDAFMAEHFSKEENPLNYQLIWDGDGHNANAALTIFRHWDSASVEKGLVGENPKTSWVISYPLLERIHYLLVAGYDVYGNLGHNLLSRLHMDFLRMEGEAGFLMLLPQEHREKERNYWYRGAKKETLAFLSNPEFEQKIEPDITYHTDNPKQELYRYLHNHLKQALTDNYSLDTIADTAVIEELSRLAEVTGEGTRHFAELSVIEILDSTAKGSVKKSADDSVYISMLKNNGHLNITSLLGESKKLLSKENTLTIVNGFLGAYPNVFMTVEKNNLNVFVDQLASVKSKGDYEQLLDNYGMRRTDPGFWKHSDKVHKAMQARLGPEFGYYDYNRLENR